MKASALTAVVMKIQIRPDCQVLGTIRQGQDDHVIEVRDLRDKSVFRVTSAADWRKREKRDFPPFDPADYDQDSES